MVCISTLRSLSLCVCVFFFNAYYFTGWGDRRGQLVCQCCDTTLTCGGLWALRVRDWPVRWKAEVCESTRAGKRLSLLRCVLQEVKGSAVAKWGYFHSFLAISLTFSFCGAPGRRCLAPLDRNTDALWLNFPIMSQLQHWGFMWTVLSSGG